MSVLFRDATADDLGFVIKTWVDSYRDCKTSGIVPIHTWHNTMWPVMKGILARDGVELYVATNPSAKKSLTIDLHGWIAVERDYHYMGRAFNDRYNRWERRLIHSGEIPLVHYVFVKEGYRRHGLARALFKHAKVDPLWPFHYSCATGASYRLMGKIPGGEWDPKICRFRKQTKEQRNDTSSIHPVQ